MSLNWLSCVSGQSGSRKGESTESKRQQPQQQQQQSERTACRCLANSKPGAGVTAMVSLNSNPPPPIPVPQGAALRSRHRDVKEDSGCYITERPERAAASTAAAAAATARWSLQEDSGLDSGDFSGPSSQQNQPQLNQQQQPQQQPQQRPQQQNHHPAALDFNSYNSFSSSSAPMDFAASLSRMAHSSCVPRLPNRRAPPSDQRELHRMLMARERELAIAERVDNK